MAAINTFYRNALKPEQELAAYKVLEVLGQGSFGITYLCEERQTRRLVAIKEYLPGQFAQREADDNLIPLSDDHEEEFVRGLARFISEAAHLDRFIHPNIVRILDVFQANNTAYLVMNYEQGESLHVILSQRGTLPERELQNILFPVLDGLEAMHNEGLIHRDIKPSNIFIRQDGSPVLLDFGSARLAMMERLSQTLTNIVTPGYAPIEQYATKREKQGPWTDIYALGATLYKVVTGVPPIEAVARAESILHDSRDPYISALKRGHAEYSAPLLGAIDCALQFRAHERPQSIAEWREHFFAKKPFMGSIDDDPPTEHAPSHATRIANLVSRTDTTLRSAPAQKQFDRTGRHRQAPVSKKRLRPAAGLFFATNLIVVAAAAFVAPNAGMDATVVHPIEWQKADAQAQYVDRTSHLNVIASASTVNIRQPLEPAPFVAPLDLNAGIDKFDDAAAFNIVPESPATGLPQLVRVSKAEDAHDKMKSVIDNSAAENTKANKVLATDQKTLSSKDSTKQKSAVDRLLKLAAAEVAALNAANSATLNPMARYQEVIAIEPENRTAASGLVNAANKYLDLVYADLDANDFSKARTHLRTAATVLSNSEKVKSARSAVRAKRAALALKNDNIVGAGGTAEEFVPDLARHTPPANLSRFDELRRRMAGERIP